MIEMDDPNGFYESPEHFVNTKPSLPLDGWSLDFYVNGRQLTLTGPYGGTIVVASDVDINYGGDIARRWDLARSSSPKIDPSWCDCDDEPRRGISAGRHMTTCRYGIIEDYLDSSDFVGS